MKILLLICANLALAPVLHAQTLNGPESVEYDHRTGITYISNKNANPRQILQRSASGTLSLFKQLSSGGQPHGLRIAGDALYVATGSTVQGFLLSDASALPVITVSGATFLNGMASDGRDRLWVSDFSVRRIHAIDLSVSPAAVTTLVANTVFTPNGLDYDAVGNRLLVAGWGANAKIAQVPLATGLIADITTTSLSNIDGIARDCAGNFYVSSWGSSALLRFDAPVTQASTPVTVLPGLANPSDIRFARHGGVVWVPNFGSNSLSTHPTDCLFDDSWER